jgi:hypothetical protein
VTVDVAQAAETAAGVPEAAREPQARGGLQQGQQQEQGQNSQSSGCQPGQQNKHARVDIVIKPMIGGRAEFTICSTKECRNIAKQITAVLIRIKKLKAWSH